MPDYRYTKWDSTARFYEQITTNPKFGLQARKMLEMMPLIRADTYFNDVLGWSSHCILTMTLPETGTPANVQVWAEDEETFLVYFDHFERGTLEPVVVSKNELLSTLKTYLQKLEQL